jgi:hypothetical protein
MLRLLAALSLISLATVANAQSLAPSDWVSKFGSVLHIDIWDGSSGALSGTYTNNNPNYPLCNGMPYHTWGSSNGQAITFTVHWAGPGLQDCQSTTVWTGTIRGKHIRAPWVITLDSGQIYKSGVDEFTRR